MHLDDNRLVLTPYDYIYLNENLRDYVMNFDFLKPFLTKTIKNPTKPSNNLTKPIQEILSELLGTPMNCQELIGIPMNF